MVTGLGMLARPTKALGIFLLVSVPLVAALGSDAGSKPSFTMADPRLGDVALYDVLTTRTGERTEAQKAEVVMGWRREAGQRLPDGNEHVIDAFYQESVGAKDIFDFGLEMLYDSGTPDLQAMRIVGSEQDLVQSAVLPFITETTAHTGRLEALSFFSDLGRAAIHPCANALAGLLVEQGGRLDVPPCIDAYFALPTRLAYTGQATVGDIRCWWFEGRQPNFELPTESRPDEARVAVCLAPGVAYPIQYTSITSEGNDSAIVDAVLSSLAVGRESRSTRVPAQPVEPIPPIEFREPVGPILVDDSGLDHPFSLSKAWQRALVDGESEVPAFMQRHPDAKVLHASYHEGTLVGQYAREWSFRLLGHQEEMHVIVDQVGMVPSTGPDLSWPVTEVDDPRYYYLVLDSTTDTNQTIRDVQLAPTPTAASLLARWEWYHPTKQANCWGYDIHYGFSWLDPAGSFAGGRCSSDMELAPATTPPGVNQTARLDYSLLDVTDEGTDSMIVSIVAEGERTTSVGPPGASPPRPATALPSGSATDWTVSPADVGTAGLAGTLLAALYLLWPKLKLAALGLFSRVAGPQVTLHPARGALLDVIQAEPGIHFGELQRRTRMANGTLAHHLGKLEHSGLVTARRLGRYATYFPGAAVPDGAAQAAAVSRSTGAQLVLDAVRRQPGSSNLQLAHLTGLRPSTVNYHLQRLQDAGLVGIVRDGRSVRASVVG